MQGDITRSTFDPSKGYTSVRMQQGRLQLDADWNEQVDIQNYLRRAQVTDMIGAGSGAAKVNPFTGEPSETSFQLRLITTKNADNENLAETDIALLPGHFYVNGVLCELSPGAPFQVRKVGENHLQISPSLTIDGRRLQEGDWIILATALEESEPEGSSDNSDLSERIQSEGSEKKLEPIIGWRIIKIVNPSNRTVEVVGNLSNIDNATMRRIFTYTSQPDLPIEVDSLSKVEQKSYFAYLDVWTRHLTAVDDLTLREVALAVPDTTTRTKTVWQLKLLAADAISDEASQEEGDTQQELTDLNKLLKKWQDFEQSERTRAPLLTACARLCPESEATRTTSNQRLGNFLYRVEIHTGNNLEGVGNSKDRPPVTFKWSRNNASIVSRVSEVEGNVIRIAKSSQDVWADSKTGDWLEFLTEEQELGGEPGVLAPLKIALDNRLEFDAARIVGGVITRKVTKVRRWDHTVFDAPQGAIPIQQQWIELENGIKVKFEMPGEEEATTDNGSANSEAQSIEPQSVRYRTGDYWLIPSRSATNDIEWPSDRADDDVSNKVKSVSRPLPQPPKGIKHLYALLGIVDIEGSRKIKEISNQRISFPPLLRALDTAGGVITGSLSIKQNLEVKKTTTTQNLKVLDKFSSNVFRGNTFLISPDPIDDSAPDFGQIQAVKVGADKHVVFSTSENAHILFPNSNVGIGEASTDAKLGVTGNAKISETLEVGKAVTLATSEGNVGIGGIAPAELASAAKLYVKGNFYVDGDSASEGQIFAKNAVINNVISNGFVQLSSIEFKEEISDFSDKEVAEVLNKLHPVKFRYKSGGDGRICAGFLAEEVPDLFATPDHQGVKLMDAIAVLTRAVQDNRKLMDKLLAESHKKDEEIAALKHILRQSQGLRRRRRNRSLRSKLVFLIGLVSAYIGRKNVR